MCFYMIYFQQHILFYKYGLIIFENEGFESINYTNESDMIEPYDGIELLPIELNMM